MIRAACQAAPAEALLAGLPRRPVACLLLALSLAVAGCAEQRIRKESQERVAAGDYEQAVRVLEDGVKQYPDSTPLRAGLVQARAEAMSRRVANASALRAAGKLDDARAELQRAQSLEPQNERLNALLNDLDTERRQQAALAEAEGLVAKKRPDAALRVIEQALRDNPRQPDLLALQRRLELDQRETQLRANQVRLTESRPISLDFRDASLRTVLDVVSRNSGINFVIDKDVRPDVRITVFLRQASVEDALDLIVSTNQLAKKVMDGQTIVIYPNTPEKQREYQEQIVRVFYLASADAKGAAAFLKAMLKVREPFVDERSNMLSLRDSPENIQLAERLIALYDAGEPEVLLEVEVLEVSSTRLTELGIKYPDSFSLMPLAPDGSDNLTLGNIRGLNRDRIALGVSGLLVNLKRQVGDSNTLANPKIRVRNKEKAKVLIGDKIPVITATTGQTGFVADTVSYLDVGLKLDVEPTIYADDEVAIRIALEVSSLGTPTKTASGTLAYQIGTRNASTLLRLRDGETQLLAGLISHDERSTSSRVPGIGDLPVLGRLFSSQLDNGSRTELVLAITPRILRNLRRPNANETELWVGTEFAPKLRPVGGVRALAFPALQGDVGKQPTVTGISSAAPPPDNGNKTDDPPKAVGIPALKWSGPATAAVNDTVEVKLMLSSGVALRGLPVEINFPKEKLQLTDVQEGEFFRQGGAQTSFSKSGDGADGQVRLGVLRNQATGAVGDGAVAILRFKAIAVGTAELRVLNVRAIGLGAAAPNPAVPAPLQMQIH